MKTSSKLLLAFAMMVLIIITFFVGYAKYHSTPAINESGSRITENRKVENYKGIVVHGGAEIILAQGNEYMLEINGNQGLVNRVTTEVKDEVLHIAVPAHRGHSRIEISITSPIINYLHLSNGIHAKTLGTLKGEELTLDMSTGTEAALALEYQEITGSASTGCNLTLRGLAEKLTLEGSTGSNIDAMGLASQDCSVKGNTGVQLQVNVAKKLEINLNTGSSLKYKGNPEIKIVSKVMGSSIEQVNND